MTTRAIVGLLLVTGLLVARLLLTRGALRVGRALIAGLNVVAASTRAGCSGSGAGGLRRVPPAGVAGRPVMGGLVVVSRGATALSERNTTDSRHGTYREDCCDRESSRM
jgi:hypothetical protein